MIAKARHVWRPVASRNTPASTSAAIRPSPARVERPIRRARPLAVTTGSRRARAAAAGKCDRALGLSAAMRRSAICKDSSSRRARRAASATHVR